MVSAGGLPGTAAGWGCSHPYRGGGGRGTSGALKSRLEAAVAAAGGQTVAASGFSCDSAGARRGEEEGGPASGPLGCRAAEAAGGAHAVPQSWGRGHRPLTRRR